MIYDDPNQISELYYQCRHAYFKEYSLKIPRFLSDSKSRSIAWIQAGLTSRVLIGMSSLYDLDEKTAVDVMSHEIIHYVLMVQGYKDWKQHDEVFQNFARQLNEKYGLNIQVGKDIQPINPPNSLPSLSDLFQKIWNKFRKR